MRWPTPPTGLRSRHLRLDGEEVLLVSFPLGATPIPETLTTSERDVVERALAGASNREIAIARGSSERTVANQLSSVFRKLGISSRAELAKRLAGSGSP